MKHPLLIAALLFLLVPCPLHADEKVDTPLILGIFPHLPPTLIDKVFSPLAKRISNITHRRVTLRTSTNFSVFADGLRTGSYDIALVQPHDVIPAQNRYDYLPLLQSSGFITPIILVGYGSKIENIADLKGKRIALPPEESAVSQAFNTARSQQGNPLLDGVERSYQHNHFSCMHRLMLGFTDACGTAGVPRVLFESMMKVNFRTIHEGSRLPPPAFVAHRRIGIETIDKLRKALLGYELRSVFSVEIGHHGTDVLMQMDQAAYEALDRTSEKERLK